MRTIWRYDIDGFGPQTFNVPAGARPIHAGLHHGRHGVWFEVDTDNPKEVRVVQIIGTGHAIPLTAPHIATYFDGRLVWHLYDLGVIMTREEWDRA